MREYIGEFIGTFIIVLFGTGAVHSAVLTGAQTGLWQVAVVWGIAVALAIYCTRGLSGAHLNPAITISFAVFRGFPPRKIPGFLLSQLSGAFLAAAVLNFLFGDLIRAFEAAKGIVRGMPGSELSAMVYGEYFPNPGVLGFKEQAFASLSSLQAAGAEFLGTACLSFFIFALTDEKDGSKPSQAAIPVLIGLSVSIIISIVAPLTQAGLNPARDFGPRLFSYFAGWGAIAIPGPRGGFFTVYILAPILGAIVGSGGQSLIRNSGAKPEARPVPDNKPAAERSPKWN